MILIDLFEKNICSYIYILITMYYELFSKIHMLDVMGLISFPSYMLTGGWANLIIA